MLRCSGTIFDATALIDFHWLGEWDWLESRCGPLYVAEQLLLTDALCEPTKATAAAHLASLSLETEPALSVYLALALTEPGLSSADRATLALAEERTLVCATDDQLMVRVCDERGIPRLRTLRLLTEMVRTSHKSAAQVRAMVRTLVNDRGKWVSKQVLEQWSDALTAADTADPGG